MADKTTLTVNTIKARFEEEEVSWDKKARDAVQMGVRFEARDRVQYLKFLRDKLFS